MGRCDGRFRWCLYYVIDILILVVVLNLLPTLSLYLTLLFIYVTNATVVTDTFPTHCYMTVEFIVADSLIVWLPVTLPPLFNTCHTVCRSSRTPSRVGHCGLRLPVYPRSAVRFPLPHYTPDLPVPHSCVVGHLRLLLSRLRYGSTDVGLIPLPNHFWFHRYLHTTPTHSLVPTRTLVIPGYVLHVI